MPVLRLLPTSYDQEDGYRAAVDLLTDVAKAVADDDTFIDQPPWFDPAQIDYIFPVVENEPTLAELVIRVKAPIAANADLLEIVVSRALIDVLANTTVDATESFQEFRRTLNLAGQSFPLSGIRASLTDDSDLLCPIAGFVRFVHNDFTHINTMTVSVSVIGGGSVVRVLDNTLPLTTVHDLGSGRVITITANYLVFAGTETWTAFVGAQNCNIDTITGDQPDERANGVLSCGLGLSPLDTSMGSGSDSSDPYHVSASAGAGSCVVGNQVSQVVLDITYDMNLVETPPCAGGSWRRAGLSWDAVAGATGYIVRRDDEDIATLGPDVLEYVDNYRSSIDPDAAVPGAEEVCYEVVPFDESGEMEPDPAICVDIMALVFATQASVLFPSDSEFDPPLSDPME